MKKYYSWYVMSSEGHLVPPKPEGPYYDKDYTLQGGWNTEEEAVVALSDYHKRNPHSEYSHLVLLTSYVKS